MKKKILAVAACVVALVALSCFFISSSPAPEDIYGFWKSDHKPPIHVLQFDKDYIRLGSLRQPNVTFFEEDGGIGVQFSSASKLFVVVKGRDKIEVTFPNPALPKNVAFTRITEKEAEPLFKSEDFEVKSKPDPF